MPEEAEQELTNADIERINYWHEKNRPCKLRMAIRKQQCGGKLERVNKSQRHALAEVQGEAKRLKKQQEKGALRCSPEVTKRRKAARKKQRIARRANR